jgi:hypothetical protein
MWRVYKLLDMHTKIEKIYHIIVKVILKQVLRGSIK